MTGDERKKRITELLEAGVAFGPTIQGALIRARAREIDSADAFLGVVAPFPHSADKFDCLSPTLSSSQLPDLEMSGTLTKLILEKLLFLIKAGEPKHKELFVLVQGIMSWMDLWKTETTGPVMQVALEELSQVAGYFLGLRDCSDKYEKEMSFLRGAREGTAGLVRTALRQTAWWSKMDTDARASSLAEQTLAPVLQKVRKDLEGDVDAAERGVPQGASSLAGQSAGSDHC